MKLVCIGDSLTTGYGVLRPESWVQLIKNKLNIEIINKGVNGDTTAGMLSRSYTDVLENNPTHGFIMGGCNDFIAERSLNMVKENIKELVKEFTEHNIIPIIGIAPPIHKELAEKKWSSSVNYDKVNNIEKEYRQWILEFAAENSIYYIDFYSCFLESLKMKKPRELYIDGLHPTTIAHKLMADCIIDAFQSIKLSP